MPAFVVFMDSQALAGLRSYNEERGEHGKPGYSLPQYVGSGHFIEATAENRESEVQQMAAYVLLTVGLYKVVLPNPSASAPGKRWIGPHGKRVAAAG